MSLVCGSLKTTVLDFSKYAAYVTLFLVKVLYKLQISFLSLAGNFLPLPAGWQTAGKACVDYFWPQVQQWQQGILLPEDKCQEHGASKYCQREIQLIIGTQLKTGYYTLHGFGAKRISRSGPTTRTTQRA